MRRIAALSVILVLAVGVLASPAAAQRDPFDPLVSEDTGGVAPAPGGQQPVQEAPPPAPAEGLPDTGAGVTDWLAVAYALVAFGAGALVITRLYRRAPA